MSQLIDIESAKEFMNETLAKADKNELIAIAHDLEGKRARFNEWLHPDTLMSLSESELTQLLRSIFSTRRKHKAILEAYPVDILRTHIYQLVHGSGDVGSRFQLFTDQLTVMDEGSRHEFASELLHFYDPDKYWMWTRWMWDPAKNTGALTLVTTEGFDLAGQSTGETYLKVGKGVAFVHSVSEAADFQFISRSLFGTDVFLSCVYSVYAYTVLRMRMTQEFNKVMPGLTEFSRRLLGVYNLQKAA